MRKFMLMAAFTVPLAIQATGCENAEAAQSQSRTLTTIADARSGVFSQIDAAPAGDSPGDMLVFDQPLLNEAGENIGSNSGFCVRTLPGQFSECQWTLTMADGTITVAGREADQGTSKIVIIGGSGAYAGVTGVMDSTPNGNRTYTQVLNLVFPKP